MQGPVGTTASILQPAGLNRFVRLAVPDGAPCLLQGMTAGADVARLTAPPKEVHYALSCATGSRPDWQSDGYPPVGAALCAPDVAYR